VEEINSKIISVDQLPTYEEAERFFRFLEERHEWFGFCREYNIFNAYNVEFVDSLAARIKSFGKGFVVEVCAGNGKLSHHLKNRGINIIATDDYSNDEIKKDESLFEKLSCSEALEKYKPKMVIASWIPYGGEEIGLSILNFSSVRYFLI